MGIEKNLADFRICSQPQDRGPELYAAINRGFEWSVRGRSDLFQEQKRGGGDSRSRYEYAEVYRCRQKG